jgi:hypothetical protein
MMATILSAPEAQVCVFQPELVHLLSLPEFLCFIELF